MTPSGTNRGIEPVIVKTNLDIQFGTHETHTNKIGRIF